MFLSLDGTGVWVLGTLGNCEDHLDKCDYVYERCELGCGELWQREELRVRERLNYHVL